MNADTTFAVVDLETTGTSVKDGDRMIQFGCALLRHGKIIQTISQMVNPDRSVPQTILRLTGINPDRLVAAPYFDEVAPVLHDLLTNTVFVAHNVNFDYPFLNAEFERVGLPKLQLEAIDTVELAQVLLPEISSFRLSDLTAYLAIRHDNPHQADSDAISTGKLLLQLTKRFQELPSPTQQALIQHRDGFIRETGDYLNLIATPPQPLKKAYVQVGSLVLRRPVTPTTDFALSGAYPATDLAKKHLLQPRYRFRKAQAKMMDAIFAHTHQPEQPLFVEAGTGLGKTLGYLLPYAYAATPEHKLVIATPTLVLQTQLMQKAIPALNDLLGRTVPSVEVKSPQHYLDLNKFAASLHQEAPTRQTQLLQMKLLVWLTQTTTGDLDELHLTTYRAPLFLQIRHTGDVGTPFTNPFYTLDFYRRLQTATDAAVIVVTNHAFLARHVEQLAGGQPFLVVDEAQHFADNTAAAFAQHMALGHLRRQLRHLWQLSDPDESHSLVAVYQSEPAMQMVLRQLHQLTETAQTTVTTLQQDIYRHFFHGKTTAMSGFVNLSLDPAAVDWLRETQSDKVKLLIKVIGRLTVTADKLTADFNKRPRFFLKSDGQRFQALAALRMSLADQRNRLQEMLRRLPELINGRAAVASITLSQVKDVASLGLSWDVFQVGAAVQQLLRQFTAPVFVGATLTAARSFDFLTRQLGYPELPETSFLKLRSPFHYRDQAKVLVATDAPNASEVSASAYADYLAQAIELLADNQHQTIVLFNSLNVIDEVYQRLIHRPIADLKELLAQGVTGSAEKIAKRFAVGEQSLLLGAASFFEGIDYPDRLLEMVILTRLPFDAPEAPITKARYAQIKASGGDPFTDDALPRATLRLRQSFGRLIRTETDRGAFVILDPRFITTQYGKKMQKSLPNIKPMTMPLNDMPEYVKMWLRA
ncbi:helicase C-terminal domain-containing protein [Lacticaseibacillus casei]|uniref:3'-5' exonuclease DinG n=1 Tax=Lacticaseibacillus casei TaxID=1582 RepID=A0AAN1EYR3_LACCA|nr:helicase C-terminal domain-containing protein [Lacticaseibacillus casei]ARY91559.1 DNA helicase [Lacticaseibacillus casei]KAB1968675.1 DNA helicase [Lacticaseibacillus casei]WNX26088.1 helicase C-terminal domain-containing protein [Lacticaseibacillus casei]WNX28861.1 helicase C-terminal domain-containing protein [Lacticaseibacillus casei]